MKTQIVKGSMQESEHERRPVNRKITGVNLVWQDSPEQPVPDRNWFGSVAIPVAVLDSVPLSASARTVIQAGNPEQASYIVDVVEEEEGFHALKAEWDGLLQTSPVNSMFLTWGWLQSWWKHLAGRRKLHIILVHRDRELVAIAPLCIRGGLLAGLFPFETFEFLGAGYVGSDYPDLIIRPGTEPPVLHALVKYLAARNLIIRFSQTLGTSRHLAGFSLLFEQHGWQVSNETTHVCPYINLGGLGWEDYLESLGHSHRYNFRRRLKNLYKDFADVRLELVASEEQARIILLKLIELHNLRWNERGGSDAFHRPELLDFHADIIDSTLRQGRLRLYVLWLNGTVAAILYGFKYNNVFYYYQSGFDTAFSRYSVGLVIMGLVIKSAIAEGIQKFDFLHGDEEYKYRWASKQHELVRIICVPPGNTGSIYSRVTLIRKWLKLLIHKFVPRSVVAWMMTRK